MRMSLYRVTVEGYLGVKYMTIVYELNGPGSYIHVWYGKNDTNPLPLYIYYDFTSPASAEPCLLHGVLLAYKMSVFSPTNSHK